MDVAVWLPVSLSLDIYTVSLSWERNKSDLWQKLMNYWTPSGLQTFLKACMCMLQGSRIRIYTSCTHPHPQSHGTRSYKNDIMIITFFSFHPALCSHKSRDGNQKGAWTLIRNTHTSPLSVPVGRFLYLWILISSACLWKWHLDPAVRANMCVCVCVWFFRSSPAFTASAQWDVWAGFVFFSPLVSVCLFVYMSFLGHFYNSFSLSLLSFFISTLVFPFSTGKKFQISHSISGTVNEKKRGSVCFFRA